MDEQHQQVKSMLTRAADAAGAFEPPPVATLTDRASRRPRSVLAAGAAAVVILALALGQLVIGMRHNPAPPDVMSPLPSPGVLSLPGPTGPAVPVSTLHGYRWSALPAAPIPARQQAMSAWTGQVLIVWGGKISDDPPRNDGAMYDPATRTWAVLPAAPLSGRVGALSGWVAGRFVVWGGYDANGGRIDDGASFDVSTGAWTKLPPAPISAYVWARLAVAHDEAVLLSVAQAGQHSVRADAYDPVANVWRSLPGLAVPTDHDLDHTTGALGVGDAVFLWYHWFHITQLSPDSDSGVSGVDTYALDLATRTWSAVPLEPDSGRAAVQPIWTGQQIVLPDEDVYCGPCSHPAPFNDPGVAIDPRTGARTPIRGGPLSIGNVGFYWTGAALLGLNFSTQSSDLNPGDTAAWNPATDTWTRLARAPLTGDVSGAAIAWTGDRLLVWGTTSAGLQFAPPGG
jgi:hypothetical protein